MGTRGLTGWRSNGVDRVAYNHMDSYPTRLGQRFLSSIRDAEIASLKALATTPMTLVDAHGGVPYSDYQVVAPFLEGPPTWSDDLSWMGLLPSGTLEPWLAGLPYWADYRGFEFSNSCEWMYLVNLDEDVLEIYTSHWRKSKDEGFHRWRVLKPRGRYATDETEEFGVLLVDAIPLSQLKGLSNSAIEGYCELLYEQYR